MALEVQDNIDFSHAYQVPHDLPAGCFRTYDVRGPVADEAITRDLAYAIGLGFGSMVREQGQDTVQMARDTRLSGPQLSHALCCGLMDAGVHVIYLGIVPSPVLYFSTCHLATTSGIMLTASHNPVHHNGFKMVLAGKTLSTQGVQDIYRKIQAHDFTEGVGTYREQSIDAAYLSDITHRLGHVARPLKVVVDAGNGVAGKLAPALYRQLGCEVIELYCELDGHFPHHHPDPTIVENLQDLIAAVKTHQADIGLAFDGDADRLGVVTNTGQIIWPDRQMMLFAKELLGRVPGATIIYDVKCSYHLPRVIKAHGGHPVLWRTGHSLIKAKLFEENALMAGELSGHLFFRDNWYGFDDGLYVGARLLHLLSEQALSSDALFATLPDSVHTPELKIAIKEEEKAQFMERFSKNNFEAEEVITIDGVRVHYSEGWFLVRPSNTSAYLTLRIEADTTAQLAALKARLKEYIWRVDPDLDIGF